MPAGGSRSPPVIILRPSVSALTLTNPPQAQWETYPESLDASNYNPLEFNITKHTERLDKEVRLGRLLSEEESGTNVKALTVRHFQGRHFWIWRPYRRNANVNQARTNAIRLSLLNMRVWRVWNLCWRKLRLSRLRRSCNSALSLLAAEENR